MVTGRSRQALPWIAENSDGWIMYPRPVEQQRGVVEAWRRAAEAARPGRFLPFAQSLYVDLDADPGRGPTPIHLGWRLGGRALLDLMGSLREIGVNHVALNLKYGRRAAGDVLEELITHVAPAVHGHGTISEAA